MMKFKGRIDQHPEPDRNGHTYFSAWLYPTVDDCNEVLSFMYADTVLQILRGQGVYRGYDCERHSDNGHYSPNMYRAKPEHFKNTIERPKKPVDTRARKDPWQEKYAKQRKELDQTIQKAKEDQYREENRAQRKEAYIAKREKEGTYYSQHKDEILAKRKERYQRIKERELIRRRTAIWSSWLYYQPTGIRKACKSLAKMKRITLEEAVNIMQPLLMMDSVGIDL